MDHRDRAAPIALARNAPVAQAEIHLALADRHVAAHLAFQPLRDFFLRLLDGHAVEEARIDHAAVAVIGGIGDDEGLRIGLRGQTTGVLPRPYLLTKSRSRWSCAGQPKIAPVP